MEHTYFSDMSTWKAYGVYYDENEKSFPLTGEVSSVRNETEWTLKKFMEVLFPEPVRFTNHYNIYPTDQKGTLKWESFNPALGTLRGRFEIVGDSIISTYESEDGVYSGTETLAQRDEDAYYAVGVSFCSGKRMASWTVNLTSKK